MTATTPAARPLRVDDRDWSKLTLGERILQLEVEGYLVVPGLLTPAHIARLKAETATLETKPADYSPHQRTLANIQFQGGAITDLLAHRPTLEFLRAAMGDELIVMS